MTKSRNNITVLNNCEFFSDVPIREPTESLGCTFFKHLTLQQDKIAQIDAKTNERDTFADLKLKSVRTALHLLEKNVTKGDIISICSTNNRNSVIPYIAAQFIGLKVAPLDPSFSLNEMEHLLKQVTPKILFVSIDCATTITQAMENVSLNSEIVIFGTTNKHTEFSTFLTPHSEETNFKPVVISNLSETAVIHFSSGTTGLPKGICLSHYAFLGQSLNSMVTENPDFEYMKRQALRINFPLTQLGYTSLYWVSAGNLVLSSVLEGFCRLICEEFNPKEIWNLIEKHKPITLVLTPFQVMEMLANRRYINADSILTIIIIGSPISKKHSLKIQKVFPEADIIRVYGQTELCGVVTNFRGNDIYHRELMKKKEKIESVGLPVRGVIYKIVDLETNENVGPYRHGELRVKSKFIMNGYHNDSCSDSFDEEGFLKTGDIAYYDDDYCFYIVDRIREAFKFRGWFIAPAALETVLLNHFAVKQAVVIGIPKEDGCHAMGLVVLKDGSYVSEEEIEKFVEKRVPERQRLRAGVKFVKSIPITVTGKVKRKEIKNMIL